MKKALTKILALVLCLSLGLGLSATVLAADPITSGKFDLYAECLDDGQPVYEAVITLDKALADGVTEEDLADAFTVKITGYERNFMNFLEMGPEYDREVSGVVISDNRKTVTLELATDVEFPLTKAISGDFYAYGATYEIKVVKEIGNLGTDVTLTYSGSIIDPDENQWAASAGNSAIYPYRWFDPEGAYAAPESGYPLVVWLHGAGETGTDNAAQLTANRVTAWGQAQTQDIFGGAYVIALQSTGAWEADKVMATINSFIASVGEDNVDRGRIYIGGCSMGGIGTWNTIKAYPDFFAAAFPICGYVTLTGEDTVNLMELPIYLIHTVEDSTVNITGSLNAYDTLKAAGKTNIYLALFEHTWSESMYEAGYSAWDDTNPEDLLSNSHSSWIYAHNDFDGEQSADKYWLETYDYVAEEGADPVTYTTTKPAELGYATFKTWLAAQSRPEGGIYYTRERETVSFGEIVSSVTVHLVNPATGSTGAAWAANRNVVVKVLDSTGKYVALEPTSVSFSADKRDVIFAFDDWDFLVDPYSPSNPYIVTMGGNALAYGGDVGLDTDKFESVTYEVSEYQDTDGTSYTTMSARYYVPDKAEYDSGSYPLIVWLHGGGEVGTDNRLPITANDVPNWTEADTQEIFGGAYVLAPQNHAVRGRYDAPEATMSLIQQFVDEMGDIDETRIYIGGCSYGGASTWGMIRNYPDYFAAAFPMCGFPEDVEAEATHIYKFTDEEIEALSDLPVYMIVSTGDSATRVTGVMQAYNDLKEAGNDNVHIALFEHAWFKGLDEIVNTAYGGSQIPGLDHWCWVYAHDDFDGKGDDYDGQYFISTSVDGTYNDGAVTVANGVLTYSYANDDGETVSLALDGSVEYPEDIGYATFKTWIAAQVNETPDATQFVASAN